MARKLLHRSEWQYRHEAAAMRAESIRRDARSLGDELVRLSQCHTDHETVLRLIQTLLEDLLMAQQLALDFDCATRPETEAPG